MMDISKFNINSLIPKYKYQFVTSKSKDITDKIIFNANCTLPRGECVGKLIDIFMDIDIALSIEMSIFEFSIVYMLNNNFNENMLSAVYLDRFNDIYNNLNDDPIINNTTLKENILNGSIHPQKLAFQSPEDIHPQRMEKYVKKRLIREQRSKSIATSDAYKCKKCGEKKVRVNLVQTRSADEPATLFITCLVCYFTFKK